MSCGLAQKINIYLFKKQRSEYYVTLTFWILDFRLKLE
jgi:hypothetical protein